MEQRKIGAIFSYINIFLKNIIYILYTPFLLRFLGHAEYGMYQLTIQIVSTLSLLSLGFSGAYVKFFWKLKSGKKEDGDVRNLNGMYLLIFSIMSLISVILGMVLIINVDHLFGATFSKSEIITTKILFSIMVCNVALTFPSSVFDSYIMANQQFVFQQGRAILSTLLQPSLTIPMLYLGFKSIAVLTVQMIITIVFLIINIRFAINKLNMKFKFTRFPQGLLRELTVFSGFLLINDVVDIVNNNVPSILVGSLVGAKAVAVYAIAIQIRTIFFQLSLSLSNVFVPKINQIVSTTNDNNELLSLMKKVGRFQLLLLSIIYGGFIVLGQYFINFWAGTGFNQAYWMIVIMIFPVLVPLSQNVGIEIQRAKNLHQFRSVILGILAIVNIVITYILVKKIGVMGSIWGYIISIGLGNGIIINIYNHLKVGLDMFNYWKNVLPVTIPAVITTCILLGIKIIFPIQSFFSFILFGLIYVVLSALFTWPILLPQEKKIFIKKLKNK
ncbi:lipopolysaccharide biosynthesis protein [Weissella paramesenteroides]|uniref:lipopolysaccharide biosynthesis protein n=1 Tax=Weissella paramesenteroides TaxID=1249 RepID=UPI003D35FF8D